MMLVFENRAEGGQVCWCDRLKEGAVVVDHLDNVSYEGRDDIAGEKEGGLFDERAEHLGRAL